MLKRIKLNKIKEFLPKLLRILAEHAFLGFLVLVFFGLIIGGILFYKYSIQAAKVEPEITKAPIQFQEKTYQEILEEWKLREKSFEEADLKTYPDPFK